MPRIPIEDLDDPRLAVYRSLKATNQTRRLDQFVVEGERLVSRLLESRFPVVSVLIADRYEPKLAADLPEAVPAYVVPHRLIDAVVGFPFHRGVLGCGQRRPWPSLAELVGDRDRRLFLVICPKLSNPENLGAIARIGDVFGIDAILAGPECPDPLSRRVLRVSMGAVLRLPVIVADRLVEAAGELTQSAGVELLAAVADPIAQPFEDVPPPRRLGLVLGDEHQGIDPRWLGLCRRALTIPMRPGASSLNVAVAAGILIYHFRKQDVPVGQA
ncbi:MAG TPA: RNA methyltransferase [Isosphaeraceae bacterium]|nr:RNA methyltransferase [Isosphaeraceae bacterium]